MKLFYAPPSPFARKVRVTALELGLMDRIELVMTAVQPGKPNPDYASNHNPLRKIPALLTDDGATLFDSTVICEYLASLVPDQTLFPAQGPERWQTLTNHALAQGMCEAAVLVRYETFLRPEANQWPTWIEDQKDKIKSSLDWFEHHPETLDAPLNLANLTLGVSLAYLDFRMPETPWRPSHPTLAGWYETLKQRPSFTNTQPDAPA